MRTILVLGVLTLLAWSGPPACAAEPFNGGSTGADGPLDITGNTTLELPPDGIFHCTTVTVAQGTTLSFTRNALNTPVYLLATGDVTIEGTLDVSGGDSGAPAGGNGGPGGFNGGWGGSVMAGQSIGGDGLGPGGGRNLPDWSGASYGTSPTGPSAGNTNTYGNLLLEPLLGGSGGAGINGAPGPGGGGGGGAILIASNSKILVNGQIKSNGGYGGYGEYGLGSGGAIRLVAPLVGGTGVLDVKGYHWGDASGGHGRIRIDCQDNQAYRALTLTGLASRGARMVVVPAQAPILDVIQVAGHPIAAGTNAPVVIELSLGAPTNQMVRIQARNFTGDVPIRVVVTPENSPHREFDATILQSSGNPPFADVPVIIPAGSFSQIHAWTR